MIDYLLCRLRQIRLGVRNSAELMPAWVPSAVRITDEIKPGDWPCNCTLFGVINVSADDLDLSFQIDAIHCEILAFRWNAKREQVLREQQRILKLNTEKAAE